jgi:hypothetical protein
MLGGAGGRRRRQKIRLDWIGARRTGVLSAVHAQRNAGQGSASSARQPDDAAAAGS